MKTKHTPGPWKVYDHNKVTINNTQRARPSSDLGEYIVECGGADGDDNAYLIAAAPEMLEELVLVSKRLLGSKSEDDRRYAQAILMPLIAKATGGEG